jgi:hypothetical protein
VILRRLIPDALELVATNADHWHPDFVMKLWIAFHPQLAPAPRPGGLKREKFGGLFHDMLFRTDRPETSGDPAPARAEVGRILATDALSGEMSAADKTYVAQVVAARTGLSQADAEKRVSDVVEQAKNAKNKAIDAAKSTADAARKTGVYVALWVFTSLLIGAFSASYMATVGGRVRDDLPMAG